MMKSESAPVYAAKMLEMDAAGSAKEMPSEEKNDALMANESAVSKLSEREKESFATDSAEKPAKKPGSNTTHQFERNGFLFTSITNRCGRQRNIEFSNAGSINQMEFLRLGAHERVELSVLHKICGNTKRIDGHTKCTALFA
jgi:hypothetical protein